MRKNKLSNLLRRYFMISTLIPFLLCIVIVYGSKVYFAKQTFKTNFIHDAMMIEKSISAYFDLILQIMNMPYYSENLLSLKNKIIEGQTLDHLEINRLEKEFDELLKLIRYSRKDIQGIYFSTDEQILYNSFDNRDRYVEIGKLPIAQNWYQDTLKHHKNNVYYYIDTENNEDLFLAKIIYDIKTKKRIGIIRINVSNEELVSLLQIDQNNWPLNLSLHDQNSNQLYSNSDSFSDNQNMLVESVIFDNQNWIFSGSVSIKDINKRVLIQDVLPLVLIYLMIQIISYAFYSILVVKVNRHINIYLNYCRQVEEEDFDQKCIYGEIEDLNVLSDSFNKMSERIGDLIKYKYELQMQQSKLEVKALHSQLNPHFIFNLLTSFIALNQLDEKQQLEASLYELSSMMRYLLNKQKLASIGEEMVFIENYLKLQKLRFQKKLKYQLIVDESIVEFELIKLLLQPLVENAIVHGLEPSKRTMEISVECLDACDDILIRIVNDGLLYDGNTSHKGHFVGLKNTQELLKKLNPNASFYIGNESNHVVVELRIPKRGNHYEYFIN